MGPGFYVVRMPKNGTGTRLIVESRPFMRHEGVPEDYTRRSADSWCDFVRSQHPKDKVFVIECPEDDHAVS